MSGANDDEYFLNYGFDEENSKILYSYHKCRIPNSFTSTFFSKHHLLYETGQLQTDFSNLYYFLPSITDRSDTINQHMKSVNLRAIDIPDKTFEVKGSLAFDPSKLDMACDEKELMTEAALKMLKKIVDISNFSIVKNADGLLSKRPTEMEMEWIGKSKIRLPNNEYKVSY